LSQLTFQQYDHVTARCRELFQRKTKDYGTAWRILRLPSLTDQIFIKAQRIRTLQDNQTRKIDEDEKSEFIGIVNYCLIALIQDTLDEQAPIDLDPAYALQLYDEQLNQCRQLMADKNHDYGEAWRDMRISSLTDLILMKLLRVKQIEDNAGKTIVSEGVAANYRDMLNYSVFSLIKLELL
jgi:hypothetical protein